MHVFMTFVHSSITEACRPSSEGRLAALEMLWPAGVDAGMPTRRPMCCDGDHGTHVLGLVKRQRGSMADAKYSRNWPRFLIRASIISELLFLILFLVGPLGASIDSDGDGVPDIPVVVTASSPLAEISRTCVINVASMKAHDAAVVRRARLSSHQSNTCACQVHRASRHLELQFFCLLRC